jgi:CMP/dCMP kinase
MTFIVAIDGPAGTGKSSVARFAAEKLKFIYVDTGAIYRALAYLTALHDVDPDDSGEVIKLIPRLKIEVDAHAHCTRIKVEGREVEGELRTEKISRLSSLVSRHQAVRADLLTVQRDLVQKIINGAIFEGRDIGTVVFPKAALKIYITANAATRAKRRFEEIKAHHSTTTYEEVLTSIKNRDERDESRASSPMQRASDAVIIDTSLLSLQEVINQVITLITEALRVYKKGGPLW